MRSAFEDESLIYGKPCELSNGKLPLTGDIMRACDWKRIEMKGGKVGFDPSRKEIVRVIAKEVKQIWNLASIPTISNKGIEKKIDVLHGKYKKLKKSVSRIDDPRFKSMLCKYQSECMTLFNVCPCKCKLNIIRTGKCKCAPENKVPDIERTFFMDQNRKREMNIGGTDHKTTSAIKKRQERQIADMNQTRSAEEYETQHIERNLAINNSSDIAACDPSSDTELNPCSDSLISKDDVNLQNRKKWDNLAMVCDRAKISDRNAALIATAALHDIGILVSNPSNVIDKNKMRRERSRVRNNLQKLANQSQSEGNECIALFFDGRKDATLASIKKGEKYMKRSIIEEHIALIGEPNSTYLGHLSPTSGCAEVLADEIFKFIQDKNMKISVIGADGTNVNTGCKNGAITRIEKLMGRPLQWSICLLHANELPLRHLIIKLDGKTTGPNGFSGPIGKSLTNCEDLEVVSFDPVESEEITLSESDLSNDQNYLLSMYLAVSRGYVDTSLSSRKPGKVVLSRWLTTACRILRLYVATLHPSDNLVEIVTYIMKVYVPMWFKIKRDSAFSSGAKHVFGLIRRINMLSETTRDIALSRIQGNAYFAHSENILIAMISDDEQHVRQLGWRRILKARSVFNGVKGLRAFSIPKLIIDATVYFEMIEWSDAITEPPLTTLFSDEMVQHQVLTGEIHNDWPWKGVPCHSQAVERMVKLVTEASGSVCGHQRRDGMIRATIQSRKKLPNFDSKKSYNVNL